MRKENKMTIRKAIKTLSFKMFDEDYELYFDCLDENEIKIETIKIEKAWAVIEDYGLSWKEVKKHWERCKNRPAEPKRFIDRPHFIAVETDQLPF